MAIQFGESKVMADWRQASRSQGNSKYKLFSRHKHLHNTIIKRSISKCLSQPEEEGEAKRSSPQEAKAVGPLKSARRFQSKRHYGGKASSCATRKNRLKSREMLLAKPEIRIEVAREVVEVLWENRERQCQPAHSLPVQSYLVNKLGNGKFSTKSN